MSEINPLLSRTVTAFSQLTTVAADLNAISDELGSSMAEIDLVLKKLNLGTTVWSQISSWQNEESRGTYGLGYAKVNGKWGLALQINELGTEMQNPEDDEIWAFNDAPRYLRLLAVDCLPTLLESLSKEAQRTTVSIRKKLADVQAIASALSPSKRPPIPLTVVSPDFKYAGKATPEVSK